MKKIIILTLLLFNLTVVFGQVCVDSRTMYSNGGLNISYTKHKYNIDQF